MKQLNLLFGIILTISILFFAQSCEINDDNNNGGGGNNNLTFTDSRDGQTYQYVQIGNQVWMAENLNYETDTGSWVYNDSTQYAETYGRLYDWETACNVCPDGWHLPSDDEWKVLEMALGMSQAEADDSGYRGTNEGSKLAGNSSLWYNDSLVNNAEFGTSGFTALPGGYRNDNGTFDYIGYVGGWWSSTEYLSANAWRRLLNYTNPQVYRLFSYGKDYGYSVRCLRDN